MRNEAEFFLFDEIMMHIGASDREAICDEETAQLLLRAATRIVVLEHELGGRDAAAIARVCGYE